MTTLDDIRASIAAHCAQLGADELDLLEHIARRLVMGGRTYGPLNLETDNRDWDREAEEELVDAMVYRTARTLVRSRRAQEPHRVHHAEMLDLRVKAALVDESWRPGDEVAK